MSKERLKEIEQKYDMWSNDFNLDPQEVEWLIKQAERVQELEVWYHSYHKEAKLNNILKIQNKLYREAILLAVYELGFALDEAEIDKTKERILQAKLILRNANVLEEIKRA